MCWILRLGLEFPTPGIFLGLVLVHTVFCFPGDSSFLISPTTRIGEGFWLAHPYSTVLNAESIGNNFRCLHCTTIGSRKNGRPTIGNNVSIGCNACVLGKIRIGDNVKIGAGSVVVKDVPSNCVVVGNPAKIVKQSTSDK